MSNDLAPDEQYEYLEWRPSRWRKQFSIKGRKMTVGQFVSTMRVSGWDVAEAARQFGLPVAPRWKRSPTMSGTRTSSLRRRRRRSAG